MKKAIIYCVKRAIWGALPMFASCNIEDNYLSDSVFKNVVEVEIVPSDIIVDTKTTFEDQRLVWTGEETMSVLIGNEYSTCASKSHSSILRIDPTTYTFSGIVELGHFSESDIRAVTIPSNPKAWISYDSADNAFTPHIPIPTNQVQYSVDIMNGDNFPLSSLISNKLLSASKQPDGSYKFSGIELQWECAAIKFNIYGIHSKMRTDEILKSIVVEFHASSDICVSIAEDFYIFGKTKQTGPKIYMAIPPHENSITKVVIYTNKASYTLDTDGTSLKTISGADIRGNVYQLGLNLSKFKRDPNISDVPGLFTAIGKVTYEDGTPVKNVSISDGFNVVQTDANGEYILKTRPDSYYIYYSVPADCEVDVNDYGQPAFFTKYSQSRIRYDFVLKKLKNGKEDKFVLFCLADPQCKEKDIIRFKSETVKDIKSHSSTFTAPCYGVTLGDVVYSEGNRNNVPQMDDMRDQMHNELVGMPVFQVFGNHDYTYFKSESPLNSDETSSTYNLKAQRAFEEVFGPIDYSWDRGDVHFVCMRDIQWSSNTNAKEYAAKFTEEQYQWLMQDLAFVPKDKMIILCIHIPFAGVDRSNLSNNVQGVVNLLKEFKEVHIMSGHTHYSRNEPTKTDGIYEHVHAAVSGCWWYSRVNGDGSPNGYGVYEIDGSTIINWYYKGVNEGMNSRDYQLRLYRGNIQGGGIHERFSVQLGEDVLLANVFNADVDWRVKVYENDVYSGDMTLIPYLSKSKDTPEVGNPTKPSVNTSRDWWAIGYHVGVVGRGHVGGNRTSYITSCYHMYKYTLKNKDSNVRVEATDRFGRTYVATEITGDFDYHLME